MKNRDRNSPHEVRPVYARTKFVFIALAVLAVYSYGWKVTEINLGDLFRDFHLVKPLVKELAQPDLFSRQKQSQTTEAEFFLAEESINGTATTTHGAETQLTLSQNSGEIGDRLAVTGLRLKPNSEGTLFWVNEIEQEFPLGKFKTDETGNFQKDITVPPSARGNRQTVRAVVSWPEGPLQVSETLRLTFEKMVETLFLALMATTLAILVAVPLSLLASRNLMTGSLFGTVVYYTVRTTLNLLRSVEPLIMAILFVVWVGIGPFAGVLALGVHSIAALGKLFSEQIESIDTGPVEAITAVGARPFQVVLFGVLPQVVLPFLALSFYRWDINVRMSTIIGFVGGGGIGFLLQQWINLLKYNEAGTALLAIAVVVITLDTLSAKIREKIH
ncbi:MAG: phosphonate ABC transporter, permease protein PhnE [Nitrospina sp.]|jgi:phosphonate transport system permease protein|nr:phosphonate ABC transporter, permease protein PhnE [Nitrospina sp.]MBT6716400.1 phosphonate ABC transporter, permease protein PhnE [Nitrospina sp.]